MKTVFFSIMCLVVVACGNTAQKPSGSGYAKGGDSLVVIDSGIDSIVDMEDIPSDYYLTQEEPEVVKVFEVYANAYSYNPATYNFTSRGKYTLQVTLYSDHSVYAIGREGISMRVQRSLEDKWDFMCSVGGNGYVYFFNTDEIIRQ